MIAPRSSVAPGSHRTATEIAVPLASKKSVSGLFSTRIGNARRCSRPLPCRFGAKITLTFLRSPGASAPREGTSRNGSGGSSGSPGRLILAGGLITLHSHATLFSLCSWTYVVIWWPIRTAPKSTATRDGVTSGVSTTARSVTCARGAPFTSKGTTTSTTPAATCSSEVSRVRVTSVEL